MTIYPRKIYVEVKEVYGNKTIYPACDDSRSFSQIAGTKTLTDNTIVYIKALGYEIEVKQPVVAL